MKKKVKPVKIELLSPHDQWMAAGGWKKLLTIFMGYTAAFFFPTFIACAVASHNSNSGLPLICFVVSPAMATVSYYYNESRP